jgi:hypothetical protein
MAQIYKIISLVLACVLIVACLKESTVSKKITTPSRKPSTSESADEPKPTAESIPGDVETVGYDISNKGAIKVYLRDSKDRPMSATVTVYRITGITRKKIESRYCTDFCVFSNLQPGRRHRITVVKKGQPKQEKDIYTIENEISVLKFILERDTSITGNLEIIVIGKNTITLMGAKVKLTKSDNSGTPMECITNYWGKCVFQNIAGGNYIVKISMDGYQPKSVNIYPYFNEVGDTYTQEIKLTSMN